MASHLVTTSFSVLFRNLLPSEELVDFARMFWSDVCCGLDAASASEVVLSIERATHAHAAFEVALIVDGVLHGRTVESDARDAIASLMSSLVAGAGRDGSTRAPRHVMGIGRASRRAMRSYLCARPRARA